MNELVLLVIMIIISFISTIIFMMLDYRYNIRIKYFSFVAKNRLLFSTALIIWFVILFTIFIAIMTIFNNYYMFLILILYFTIFMNLYHNIRNWKVAYDVYIKNIDLLIRAKENDKRKKNRKRNVIIK